MHYGELSSRISLMSEGYHYEATNLSLYPYRFLFSPSLNCLPWKIYNDSSVPVREKLLALKLIIQSNEARFRLLSEGPSVLVIKSLEDRLNRIEGMGENQIHR